MSSLSGFRKNLKPPAGTPPLNNAQQRQQALDSLAGMQRLLQQFLPQHLQLQQLVQQQQGELQLLQASVAALIELAGTDKVTAVAQRHRDEANDEAAKATATFVAEKKADGTLILGSAAGPKTMVCLTAVATDGSPYEPPVLWSRFLDLTAELKQAFAGKGVGHVAELTDCKVTLAEVLEQNPTKAPAMVPTPAATGEAPEAGK